ncbi:hypothetical protein JCM8202v2_005988 [Rhodotorula sphaerocarpa]
MPRSNSPGDPSPDEEQKAGGQVGRSSSTTYQTADNTEFLAPHHVRMSYRIGRSEQGVMTFEPYKSHLLPLWRFKTPDLAQESADRLEAEFERFEAQGDFVGADLTRKGMTRSTRYANRAGGRKYDATSGDLLPKTTDHPGAALKLESARIFRAAWERVKQREGYARLRKQWEKEKKEWERKGRPGDPEAAAGEGMKEEEEEPESDPPKTGRSTKKRGTSSGEEPAEQKKSPSARPAKRRKSARQKK